MQRDKNLIKDKLDELKNFVYYRQRFDACPHFMFFVGDAHASETNLSKYPYGQKITCAHFHKNKADWYHVYTELEDTANKIIEISKTNSKIAEEMVAEFKPREDQFYKLCSQIREINLSELSNKELIELYNQLRFVYTKKLNCSALIDGFALSTDTLIARKLEQHLKKYFPEERFSKVFEALTAPIFLSFLQEEDVAFLKLIQNNNHKEDNEESFDEHQSDFFWINNNYVKDNILDLNYFKERSTNYTNINVSVRINELEELPTRNKDNKEALFQKLKIPNELINLLHITDVFSHWQDERKKGTFWATHYFSLLLEEVAKRTRYSLIELKYSMPTEIEDIITEKIDSTILQERFDNCFLVWTPNKFDLITDETLIKEIVETNKKEEIDKEIKGMCVSLGKVVGRVKILESSEEMNKIEVGDVLVAVMTRPDYLPAMKKAAAIITDEGGITCHAAIVAREMGIPCIVGTKIATQILKDGDLVEVNANHSIVRRLK